MRSRNVYPVLLAVLGLPALLAAQDAPAPENYGIRLEYSEFRPTLSGDIRNGTSDREGTELDFEDDLGIEDERSFEAKGAIQFKKGHKLRGSYTRLRFNGDLPNPRTFDYGFSTFARGQRVLTSIKGGYYSAEYEWDLVRRPGGFLGFLIGAKVFDVDTLVVAPDQGVRETDTVRTPIPVIGATTRLYFGRLSFQGEISGLTIGDRGHILDGNVTIRAHFSDRLAVGGGYRLLKLRGNQDHDLLDFSLNGFQVGLELSL